MRWSESKSKTSTGKQTLGDSSDPTPATNIVAELGWAKGHVAGPNNHKKGDNKSLGAGQSQGVWPSLQVLLR